MARPERELEALSFPWPDIICALPSTAVIAAVETMRPGQAAGFRGWDELVKAHERHKGEAKHPKGFKPFVFNALQIPNDADAFVANVLGRCDRDSEPDLGLARQITRMTAVLDDPVEPE